MRRLLVVVASIALAAAGTYGIRSVQQRVEAAYAAANFRIYVMNRGPIYHYSIVPGGIHSPLDFETAQRDPAVKAHYSGIGKLAHLQQAPGDYYDSYRIGDHVYWTSYRVRVPASEALWVTDRGELVRPRCGNRLSLLPMQPTLSASLEPTPDELNEVLPEDAKPAPVSYEILPYSPQAFLEPSGVSAAPPAGVAPMAAILPMGGILPGFAAPGPVAVLDDVAAMPKPAEAPEPSSWWLSVFGIAGVAYVQWRKRK